MKFLLATLGLAALALGAQAKQSRDFSVFQVVRFPNGACESNNKLNGTCFTKQECEDKEGKESGTCADGYGVCCTFEIDECGKTSSQNNTYITKPTKLDAGSCTTRICPSGEDICRLRIDFMTFTIAQPETSLINSVKVNGQAVDATPEGQCHTDSFRVTCPGGPSPNVICGTNTGQHMYVDAAKTCNDLTFFIGRATATRMWNVKVSQIDCEDMVSLPPPGCTQWYTEDTGEIQTFNYGTNQKHLANQNQNICFRKNKGMCGVCLRSVIQGDFAVSGMAANTPIFVSANCCGYGATMEGFDCLEVPGAQKGTFKVDAAASRLCGNGFLSDMAAMVAPAPGVCTSVLPLSVRFVSDAGEHANEAATNTGKTGFKLKYELKSTCA